MHGPVKQHRQLGRTVPTQKSRGIVVSCGRPSVGWQSYSNLTSIARRLQRPSAHGPAGAPGFDSRRHWPGRLIDEGGTRKGVGKPGVRSPEEVFHKILSIFSVEPLHIVLFRLTNPNGRVSLGLSRCGDAFRPERGISGAGRMRPDRPWKHLMLWSRESRCAQLREVPRWVFCFLEVCVCACVHV